MMSCEAAGCEAPDFDAIAEHAAQADLADEAAGCDRCTWPVVHASAWLSPTAMPVRIRMVGVTHVVVDVGDEDFDVRMVVPIAEAASYIWQRGVAP